MFCKYCGTEITNDIQFCPKCGKAIAENSQVNDGLPKKKKTKLIAGIAIIAIVVLIGICTLQGNKISEEKLSDEEQFVLGKWEVLSSDHEGSFTFKSDHTGSFVIDEGEDDTITTDFTWSFDEEKTKETDDLYVYDVKVNFVSETREYLAGTSESDEDDSCDVMVMARHDEEDDEDYSLTLYREK